MNEQFGFINDQGFDFKTLIRRFPTERARILPFMQKIVRTAIKTAPILRHGEEVQDIPYGYHNLVLNFTEDHHYLPLLENVLFAELVDCHNRNTPDFIVSPVTLMSFDPEYPKIVRRIGNRQIVRGESFFGHEREHYHLANDPKINLDYLVLSFYKYQTNHGYVLGVDGLKFQKMGLN